MKIICTSHRSSAASQEYQPQPQKPVTTNTQLAAFIPGYGAVSDADALLLQQYRGAKPFQMEADWQQSFTGTVEPRFLFPSTNFNWTGL